MCSLEREAFILYNPAVSVISHNTPLSYITFCTIFNTVFLEKCSTQDLHESQEIRWRSAGDKLSSEDVYFWFGNLAERLQLLKKLKNCLHPPKLSILSFEGISSNIRAVTHGHETDHIPSSKALYSKKGWMMSEVTWNHWFDFLWAEVRCPKLLIN